MTTPHPQPPRTSVQVKRAGTEPPPPLTQHTACGVLTQTFGLAPRAAALAVLVDLMVFGGDTLSGELLLPLGAAAATVLGFIVYRMQRLGYGDGHDAALLKALTVGVLTAVPMPLTPLLAIPTGIIGLAKSFCSK